MTRDEAIRRALADIRAIPDTASTVAPAPQPSACCEGTYTAYQRHVRRAEPTCEASKAAARAYAAAWRARNPDYFRESNRRWRAKQKGAPGA